MASDVNMSSEGSGQSRLRQFGLYKTIDSQTAEFLKLSRKRQIRRGCACAAVSTVITVTVVVSFLLIYEYALRSDLNIPNNTFQKFDFNAVNDAKATFDKNSPVTKTTSATNKNNGKLVAIILKALDQNRYLETVVDEHSSQRPHATDYPFQKNVFGDRNRKTSSKMYDDSNSQRLFKNSRRDSYMKARKIVDYQRVMTYLNTMSVGKKTTDTSIDISSTSNPDFLSYLKEKPAPIYNKKDILQEYNYPIPELPEAVTMKKRDHVSCTCPPRSKLVDILHKLYTSIQELRPKAKKSAISTKDHDHYLPKESETVASPINIENELYTTKMIYSIPNKTLSTQSPVFDIRYYHTDKANTTNEPSDTTTVNYDTSTHSKDNTSSQKVVPWKLDFGVNYDEASNVYIQTESTTRYVKGSNEQFDYYDKTYTGSTESIGHLNSQSNIKTHEIKRTVSAEQNEMRRYIDSLSKIYKSTLVVNQPPTPMVYQLSTENTLDTGVSLEVIDPYKPVVFVLPRAEVSETDKSVKNKEKSPRRNTASVHKAKKHKCKLCTKSAPVDKKRDQNESLSPMLRSYLLSKDDYSVLSLGAETTTLVTETTTIEGGDLPFNLKFLPSEEDEHTSILKDRNRGTVPKNQPQQLPVDANTEEYNGNKYKLQNKNGMEQPKVLKTELNEKNIPTTQTWVPRYVARNRTRPTEAPTNSEPKKPKIKEIFYMTGGDTPVDDFEDHLSALMYYDKSPVNYTALANSFLNKMDNSIEMSKSMLPESRPSPLEIRRNHEPFEWSHFYDNILE